VGAQIFDESTLALDDAALVLQSRLLGFHEGAELQEL